MIDVGSIGAKLQLDNKGFLSGIDGALSASTALKTGLVAVGAAIAGTVATIGALAGKTAQYRDSLVKAARAAGETSESFSGLNWAASQSGVSTALLQKTLATLNAPTKAQTKALKDLGISVTDSSGKMRTGSEIMLAMADKMGAATSAADKSAIAVSVLGTRGAQLVNLLGSGSGAIEDLTQQAERLGLVFTDEQGAASEKFNDNIASLKASFDGLQMVVGSIVVDFVNATGALEGLTEAVATVTGWTRDLVDAMSSENDEAGTSIDQYKHLINTYSRLASKRSLTADETDRLDRLSQNLQQTEVNLGLEVIETNKSLSERIKLMRAQTMSTGQATGNLKGLIQKKEEEIGRLNDLIYGWEKYKQGTLEAFNQNRQAVQQYRKEIAILKKDIANMEGPKITTGGRKPPKEKTTRVPVLPVIDTSFSLEDEIGLKLAEAMPGVRTHLGELGVNVEKSMTKIGAAIGQSLVQIAGQALDTFNTVMASRAESAQRLIDRIGNNFSMLNDVARVHGEQEINRITKEEDVKIQILKDSYIKQRELADEDFRHKKQLLEQELLAKKEQLRIDWEEQLSLYETQSVEEKERFQGKQLFLQDWRDIEAQLENEHKDRLVGIETDKTDKKAKLAEDETKAIAQAEKDKTDRLETEKKNQIKNERRMKIVQVLLEWQAAKAAAGIRYQMDVVNAGANFIKTLATIPQILAVYSATMGLPGTIAAGVLTGLISGLAATAMGAQISGASAARSAAQAPPVELAGLAAAGMAEGFVSGGLVSGAKGVDQIPARLTDGEFVMSAPSVQRIGVPTLEALNGGTTAQGAMAKQIIFEAGAIVNHGVTMDDQFVEKLSRQIAERTERQTVFVV